MKEFLIKNKVIIFRAVGSFMLLIGFVMFFWSTPKKGFSENEIAAANVARMEARVVGGTNTKITKQSSSAEIMKAYKDKQAAQNRYFLITIMVLGIGFLGYSFVRRD